MTSDLGADTTLHLTLDESTVQPRRVALVTGGSGALGGEICRHLVDEGYDVALTYRANVVAAEDLARELRARGRTVATHRVDLADSSATAACVTAVLDQFSQIDVLVHAAGPHIPQLHLSRVTPSQFAEHIHQEMDAFFNLVHACVPALRTGGASVVAVTTAATHRYPVRDGLSAAPKAGVETLVRAFAAEEGRFGVRFNAVGPGMLTDGMAERLMASGDLDERALAITRTNIPLGFFGNARDISEAVLFLASPRARFITGQKLDVDGGYGI